MASNFAFMPMGLSTTVTVGGAAPATVSMTLQGVGQTVTQSLTSGNYQAQALRIVTEGTASVFVNFGATAAAISVSATNGARLLQNTTSVLRHGGQPFVAFACASTFTVTLTFTPGEGMA